MRGVSKEMEKNKHKFMIRNTKTPLLSDRSKTERVTPVCKPQIDFNSNF